jgi:hypothetical protein
MFPIAAQIVTLQRGSIRPEVPFSERFEPVGEIRKGARMDAAFGE